MDPCTSYPRCSQTDDATSSGQFLVSVDWVLQQPSHCSHGWLPSSASTFPGLSLEHQTWPVEHHWHCSWGVHPGLSAGHRCSSHVACPLSFSTGHAPPQVSSHRNELNGYGSTRSKPLVRCVSSSRDGLSWWERSLFRPSCFPPSFRTVLAYPRHSDIYDVDEATWREAVTCGSPERLLGHTLRGWHGDPHCDMGPAEWGGTASHDTDRRRDILPEYLPLKQRFKTH